MMNNVIFVHGLESSGHGFKGNLFRERVSGCLTPDLREYDPQLSYSVLLNERMRQLRNILEKRDNWKIIGSSFGGLMASLYSLKNPLKVEKLILLAPALNVSELDPEQFDPIKIPVVVYHGKNDQIVPVKETKKRAEKLFKNLEYNIVDDDHMLHPTVESIDWDELLEISH